MLEDKQLFENFTPAAIRAIASALQSAKNWGHEKAGAEHFLIGISAHKCLAQELLAQNGFDLKSLEKRLLTFDGKRPLSNKVDIPFDASAKDALESAQNTRSELGQEKMNTGHLLLGIISDPRSKASQILSIDAGNSQRWRTAIEASIAIAIQLPEFEIVPEQKVTREEQLAKIIEWARTIPNWKEELKLVMQAAGVNPPEVEEGLSMKK